MWASELPYNDYQLQVYETSECKKKFDVPSLLRGSRFVIRKRNTQSDLSDEFCYRAVYVLKITTPYTWEHHATDEVFAPLLVIKNEAHRRFGRVRQWTLTPNHYERFQDGKRVQLHEEPDKQKQYDMLLEIANAPDLSLRLEATKELMKVIEKLSNT